MKLRQALRIHGISRMGSAIAGSGAVFCLVIAGWQIDTLTLSWAGVLFGIYMTAKFVSEDADDDIEKLEAALAKKKLLARVKQDEKENPQPPSEQIRAQERNT